MGSPPTAAGVRPVGRGPAATRSPAIGPLRIFSRGMRRKVPASFQGPKTT